MDGAHYVPAAHGGVIRRIGVIGSSECAGRGPFARRALHHAGSIIRPIGPLRRSPFTGPANRGSGAQPHSTVVRVAGPSRNMSRTHGIAGVMVTAAPNQCRLDRQRSSRLLVMD